MAENKKKGFFDQEIEWKVSLFTTLLVIAMFVTVAIYVYAGDQQNLPTRKYGNVDIRKNLKIGQQTFQKSDVVSLSDGDIISPVDGSNKIYIVQDGETLILPSAGTLDNIKQFSSGYTLSFSVVNNSSTNTLTISNNDSRITFLNGNYKEISPDTSRDILIRKLSSGDYQVVFL